MAGDWIKMQTDLYLDPKISLMADRFLSSFDWDSTDGHSGNSLRDAISDVTGASRVTRDVTRDALNVTRHIVRNACVGGLLSVWGVLRRKGERLGADLLAKGSSLNLIDDLACMPGFGRAMLAAGWVVEHPDGLLLPCFFEENNVEPGEKQKSKGAVRQAEYRARKAARNGVADGVTRDVTGDVTSDVTVTPRDRVRDREERAIFSSAGADAVGDGGKGEKIISERRVIPGREIVEAYHEQLPMLPQVRQLTEKRKQWLKARWMEHEDRQSVEWWRGFFRYVSESDFLTGRNGQWTGCSFEWLINSSNFVKVIEGNYENKGAAA